LIKKGTLVFAGIILLFIVPCFMHSIVGNPGSVTLTLNPTDDTYISRDLDSDNLNFNDRDFMEVENSYGAYGEWGEHSLIKFDLSSISSDVSILSANLYLYYHTYQTNNPVGRDLNLYRVAGDWNEDIVTWDTQPSYAAQPTSYATVPSSTGVWMEWNVTNDVQDFVDGMIDNYGWIITDDNYWGTYNIPVTSFRTMEYGDYVPYLEIEYEDEEHIITVTSPHSSGTWYQGGTNTIGWSSENAGSYVDIDLYQDGYFHSDIASFEYNDGSYFWTVPSGVSTSSYYEIRITDSSDSSVYGYSDSFYIDEPLESYIIVSSPYSGDMWYQGDTSTISWSSYNAGDYVDVDLYEDGYYHSIIALSTYNDGSYSWTVPSGLNTDSYYEISITDSSDSSVYGYSGYLSIQKSSGLNFQEWIIIIAVFMVISLIIIIVVIVVIKGNPKGLPKGYRNRDTEEKLKLNKMKEKVKRWKKEGYNVDEIEQMIKSDKER